MKAICKNNYVAPKNGRDSQRTKVYRAEWAFWSKQDTPSKIITLDQAKAIRDYVWSLPYRTFPDVVRLGRRPELVLGKGRGGATSYFGKIKFKGKDSIIPWIVVHELAHEISPTWERHGPVYCGVYLHLVERVFSFDAREELALSFRLHGVKVAHLAPYAG